VIFSTFILLTKGYDISRRNGGSISTSNSLELIPRVYMQQKPLSTSPSKATTVLLIIESTTMNTIQESHRSFPNTTSFVMLSPLFFLEVVYKIYHNVGSAQELIYIRLRHTFFYVQEVYKFSSHYTEVSPHILMRGSLKSTLNYWEMSYNSLVREGLIAFFGIPVS
jgi:hypothetical protein